MEIMEKITTQAPSFEELTSEDRAFVDGYIEEIYSKLQMSHVSFIKRTLSEYVTKYVVKSKDLVIRQEVENDKIIYMYEKAKKISGAKESSIFQYDLCIRDFNHFINKPFNKVDADDIRSYLLKLKEKNKNSERTINGKRVIIQNFFKYLLSENYIHSNPCDKVYSIKYKTNKVLPFNPFEMELLRMACENERERAMVEVFYSSGIRCGELTHIKLSDLDLIKMQFRIDSDNKSGEEDIGLLNERAVIHIKRYLEERIDTSPYLFVSGRRPFKRLEEGGVLRIIKNLGKRAGIENAHPHRFRHTMASDLLNRGTEITTVQKILRHKKLDTTQIYAEMSTDNVRNQYNKCIV